MTVADKIKNLREKAGLSQEELAHKMGLKSRSSITRIEKSGDNVSLKDVERFSNFFGCSPLYLMGWDGESQNEGSEHEQQFVALYSRLDENQRKLIDNMLETLASKR